MSIHRRGRRDRGQAVIETTVVAMFLVILLLGCIGFGNIMQASIRIESAARYGSRLASTGAGNTEVRDAVMSNLSKTGSAADVPGEVAVGINPADELNRPFNTDVTVEVWWKYPVPIPVFNLLVKERMLYAHKTMVMTVSGS